MFQLRSSQQKSNKKCCQRWNCSCRLPPYYFVVTFQSVVENYVCKRNTSSYCENKAGAKTNNWRKCVAVPVFYSPPLSKQNISKPRSYFTKLCSPRTLCYLSPFCSFYFSFLFSIVPDPHPDRTSVPTTFANASHEWRFAARLRMWKTAFHLCPHYLHTAHSLATQIHTHTHAHTHWTWLVFEANVKDFSRTMCYELLKTWQRGSSPTLGSALVQIFFKNAMQLCVTRRGVCRALRCSTLKRVAMLPLRG